MTMQPTRPGIEPETLARTPLQQAIDAALPAAGTAGDGHHDYDGRGLKIQPLDHLEDEADCQRFMIR